MMAEAKTYRRQLSLDDGVTTHIFTVNNVSEYTVLLLRSGYLRAREEWATTSTIPDEKTTLHVPGVPTLTVCALLQVLVCQDSPSATQLLQLAPLESIVIFFDYMLVDSFRYILDGYFLEELHNGRLANYGQCIEYLNNLNQINQVGMWIQFFQNFYRITIDNFRDVDGSFRKNSLKKKMYNTFRRKNYLQHMTKSHCRVCNSDVSYRTDRQDIAYISRTPCCHQVLHKHCVPHYLFYKRNPKVVCTYCQTPIRDGRPDLDVETLHSCLLRQGLRREANVEISPLNFPTLNYEGSLFPFFFPPT